MAVHIECWCDCRNKNIFMNIVMEKKKPIMILSCPVCKKKLKMNITIGGE